MAEEEKLKVTVTTTRKIFKYAEGVEPIEGNEYEIAESQDVLTGEEAEKLLKEMGVKTDATD
jgi:hypothetical protein